MADIEEIRKTIHLLKPKTFKHLKEDESNLDDILKEYEALAKLSKDLVPLKGKKLVEALTTQPNEYLFFRRCQGNLKTFLDYQEAKIRYNRGRKYKEISKEESRNHNDRAINSLIDSEPVIFDLTFDYLKVKELYDTFQGIVESYNQRGYSLNNITKALEIADDIVL